MARRQQSLYKTHGLLKFIVLLVSLLIFDVMWIFYIVGPIYQEAYGNMMGLRIIPAVLFYILFAVGLYYFAIFKNFEKETLTKLQDAILFGVCVYGGYALTVLAVFEFYHTKMALLEIIWGALVSVLTVSITEYAVK